MGKHAFNTVVTRFFVTLIMLLQSSMWTRLLAPEGRGLYAKLQASQNLLILFLGFGLTSGVVYFCSSRKSSPAELWNLSIFTGLLGSLVTGGILAATHFFPTLDFIFPTSYKSLFFMIYFWFVFAQTQIQLSMNSFLAAEHKFSEINKIDLFSSGLRFVLVAVAFLIPAQRLTLEMLFSLDVLAYCSKTILITCQFRNLKIPTLFTVPKWNLAKPVLVYSMSLYALYLIQFFYQRIDIWIIERWNGLAALGIFSCAVGLAQYLTILPMALNTVLTPHMSRSEEGEAFLSLAHYSRINATLLAFPVVIFGVFPSQILHIIYGPDFIVGAHSLRMLALAYWFTSVKHIFVYYNAVRARLKVNLMIECIGLALGLTLNLILIPRYGIDGASMAFLISAIATGLLSYGSILRFAPERRANLFLFNASDWKTLKISSIFK